MAARNSRKIAVVTAMVRDPLLLAATVSHRD